MNDSLADARRALARLRRALAKGRRELRTMRSSLEGAGDESLPGGEYQEAAERLAAVDDWLNSEEARLQAKKLERAGLGAVRPNRGPRRAGPAAE